MDIIYEMVEIMTKLNGFNSDFYDKILDKAFINNIEICTDYETYICVGDEYFAIPLYSDDYDYLEEPDISVYYNDR